MEGGDRGRKMYLNLLEVATANIVWVKHEKSEQRTRCVRNKERTKGSKNNGNEEQNELCISGFLVEVDSDDGVCSQVAS